MGNAGALGYSQVQPAHSPRDGFILVLLDEFRRAVAAERRHSELRHMDRAALAREGITRADVPRCVFEEYYRSTESGRGAKDMVRQHDVSFSPSPRASRWQRGRLDYRRKFQQKVIALAWRKGLVAAT